MESMPEVKHLDLTGCRALKEAPDLSACTALETLNLSGCQALNQPPNLSACTALQRLWLYYCSALKEAPDLSVCTTLRTLDLKYCLALDQPPNLRVCAALQTLDLCGCRALKEAPDLSACVALQRLNLSNCLELRTLEVSRRWVPNQPSNLSTCTALQNLNLSGCKALKKAPDLSACAALLVLDLSNCPELQTLEVNRGWESNQPPNLSTCTALQTLNLSGCRALKKAPDLSACTALKTLNLDFCPGLNEAPDLSACTALKVLNMRGCKRLMVLPGLDKLAILEELDLEACSSIQELRLPLNVKSLNLKGCQSLAPPNDTLSDNPNNTDLIDIGSTCGAVAGFLLDSGTKAPVTMAFHGVWGKGKSTAMKILEGKVKSEMIVVWFKAWLHRDPKEIWAGLAVEVGRSIESRLSYGRRLCAYVDYAFEQRKSEIVVNLFSVLLSSLAGALVVALGIPTSLKEANGRTFNALYGTLVAFGVVGWVAFFVWRMTKLLKPVSQQIAGYVVSPTIEHLGYVGYQNRVIQDLQFLGSWAAPHSAKVVVFIDDLDRSQDDAIVSVLEAVNIVLGGCDPQKLGIFTVFGLDIEMTTRAIYKHFKGTTGTSKVAEASQEESRRFLRKIIQLSIELPPLTEAERGAYAERLVGRIAPSDQTPKPGSRGPGDKGPELLSSLVYQTQTRGVPEGNGLELETPVPPVAVATSIGREVPRHVREQWLRASVGDAVDDVDPSASPRASIAFGVPWWRKVPFLWGRTGMRKACCKYAPLEQNEEPMQDAERRQDGVAAELLGGDYKSFLPDNPRHIKSMINNYRLAFRVLLQRVHDSSETYNRWRIHLVTWVVLIAAFPGVAPLIKAMCCANKAPKDVLEALRDEIAKKVTDLESRKKSLGRIGKQQWDADKEKALLEAKHDVQGELDDWNKLVERFGNFEEAAQRVTNRKRCGSICFEDLMHFRCFSAGLSLRS